MWTSVLSLAQGVQRGHLKIEWAALNSKAVSRGGVATTEWLRGGKDMFGTAIVICNRHTPSQM